MPKCFIMIGIPGSGKSFEAERIAEKENAVVVSSDGIRKMLYGDENCIGDNNLVFEKMHERLKAELSDGKNVIMDSTNLVRKYRMRLIDEMSEYATEIIAVYMKTPYDVCLARQDLRDRKVPEAVILKMHRKLDKPTDDEGWDRIVTVDYSVK